MDRPICPKCHKVGVQKRLSKNNRPYFANVETYPSGISYFRSLHTSEQCEQNLVDFEARVVEGVAASLRQEKEREEGLRAQVLIPRYKAMFGEEAVRDNWDRVAARWLPTFTAGCSK